MTDPSALNLNPPPMSVSMPEVINWHMILDHELTQLTKPEAGVIGSLGFVGLGAVLGLVPQTVATYEKVSATPPLPVGVADMACIGVFFLSLAVAVICLGIGCLYWLRNRGTAATIRQRSKHGFTFSGKTHSS